MCGPALHAGRFLGFNSRQPRDSDGRAIWKTCNQLQVAAHCFDVVAQRRDEQVAPLFQPGHAVLPNFEGLADPSLREPVRATQIS